MMTPQQRAAKTRTANREGKRLYEEVSKPAHEKMEKILDGLLKNNQVMLRFVGPWRLKGGVITGRLLAVHFGGLSLTVLPTGYAKPKRYASSFWEVME